MKKILFILLLLIGSLSFSEYIKEGTYNGANDNTIIPSKIIFLINFLLKFSFFKSNYLISTFPKYWKAT